jgi:plasmid rolling circle replication initiator protein Rep
VIGHPVDMQASEKQNPTTEYAEAERRRFERVVLATKRLARTRDGKILWSYLKAFTGLEKPVFSSNPEETHRAALVDGKRIVASHLIFLNQYELDPDRRKAKEPRVITNHDNE